MGVSGPLEREEFDSERRERAGNDGVLEKNEKRERDRNVGVGDTEREGSEGSSRGVSWLFLKLKKEERRFGGGRC